MPNDIQRYSYNNPKTSVVSYIGVFFFMYIVYIPDDDTTIMIQHYLFAVWLKI